MNEAWQLLEALLGLGRDVGDVTVGQMALRTLLIYGAALVIVRVGSKRFLSRASAFDVIVAVMFGSVVGRAINGSAPFFPTLAAGIVLVGLHWAFAALAFHTDWFGSVVKGNPVLLVRDGQIQWKGMRKSAVSERDLAEGMRIHGREPDPSKIKLAYVERSGRISIVAEKSEPRILDVAVEEGVQTVRIKLE
jgi:uncharacterized membrane protein YcaP (DUF421 family)